MNTLVVGGTSGLGLEIGKKLSLEGKVLVTGRGNPEVEGIESFSLDLTAVDMPALVDDFVNKLPQIDVLVYAAGIYPAGRVTDLSPQEIENSLSVAGRGFIYFVRSLLLKQGKLDEVIVITSIAQFQPSEKEVVYNFIKAGLGHFANGLAKDERVGKVLVAAPSAMRNADEPGDALDRAWVAEQIVRSREGNFDYKLIKLLRRPARVEVIETR